MRTTGGKWVIGVTVVWAASLVMAFWFRDIVDQHDATNPVVVPVQTSTTPARATQEGSSALREENEQLRTRVSELEAALEELKRAKQAVNDVPSSEKSAGRLSNESIRERWQIWRDRSVLESSDAMLWNLENSLGLMFDLIMLGEPGLDSLIDVANDPKAATEEKDLALQGIAYWPSKKSLKLLLANETIAGENNYTDALWRQVTCLPTSDLAEDLPTLERLLLPEIGNSENPSEKQVQVLASLAFLHGSGSAQEMACEPAVWQEAGKMLGEADLLHTAKAKEYVERVVERHSDAECRRYAREILQQWDKRQ